VYCLSLLMLLKIFRCSAVVIRKHNGAVVCFIWSHILVLTNDKCGSADVRIKFFILIQFLIITFKNVI